MTPWPGVQLILGLGLWPKMKILRTIVPPRKCTAILERTLKKNGWTAGRDAPIRDTCIRIGVEIEQLVSTKSSDTLFKTGTAKVIFFQISPNAGRSEETPFDLQWWEELAMLQIRKPESRTGLSPFFLIVSHNPSSGKAGQMEVRRTCSAMKYQYN